MSYYQNEMVILEGPSWVAEEGCYTIQKRWGYDTLNGNYCCVDFSWDDEYQNQNGDMVTLLIGLFLKGNDKQKMMLRIIINELRRHIMEYPEFTNYFTFDAKVDNHVMFFLKTKTDKKQIWWNKIKSYGIDIKKIIFNSSREDRRGYDKILKRHIDC